jgi:peptidyl-prolyl cis-trans isomerase D
MAKRGKTKAKAANTIVWVILLLLIVGLAGFGTTNFGGSVRTVATVGDTEIDVEQYGRAVQQQLQQIQANTGQPMTFAQAQEAGIDSAVLQRLLTTAALDEAARKAGLSIGDEEVSQQIVTIPAFQGVDGKFDREAYTFALERNGMSVQEFEESVRNDLARNLYQTSLVSGVGPSASYGDAIYDYIAEARDISYIMLRQSDLAEPVAPPTDDEIKAYYDANPDTFTRPEIRKITYAWLTPEMLAGTIEIDDAALRDLYKQNEAEYIRPERRMVDRLVFPDDASAQEASSRLKSGAVSFDDLVTERGLGIDDVDLDAVTQGQLGAAGEAVFAMTDPGETDPLPTDLGPAIFRVNAILAAQTTSFEDALPELRDELAATRARDAIAGKTESIDDMLAGGATLEELAEETDMELGQIDWTGAETDGLAAYEAFAPAATSVTADDYPQIQHLDDGGIFALRLDSVEPPAVQPLDEVRDQAAEGALAQKTTAALQARADALLAEVQGGKAFAELGLEVASQTGMTRTNFGRNLPPELVTAAFDLEAEEARVVRAGGEVYLVRLDKVTPADRAAPGYANLQDGLRSELTQGMAQDILTELARAIEQHAGLEINQTALNAVNAQIP